MVKQHVKVKYNSNCQAYTAIITDERGSVRGMGYGNSKQHAIKVAKMEAGGKFTSEGRVAKVSVCI